MLLFELEVGRMLLVRPGLMGPQEFQALPSHPADYRIPYGNEPDQFGDFRVPPGPGPHPLVMLVHGGCWKAQYSTLKDLAPIADVLKGDGIVTWNIEYRRLGQEGGGWPGTYEDIAKALDLGPSLAQLHELDIDRVVVLGHSAGGHLAMCRGTASAAEEQSSSFGRAAPYPRCDQHSGNSGHGSLHSARAASLPE